ncbi:hypothetical protein EV363DRAFT_1302084 [Boletus edulis]|nr:hypothetical protein EV363DRAFT_1302084 [Boletus edulis]
MTAASTACSSDNTTCSKQVDDTMNALTQLLKGVQLSEDHAARIVDAVRAIADLDSDTRTPTDKPLISVVSASPKLPPAMVSASPNITDPGTGDVPDKGKVAWEAPMVPSGHYVAAYKGTNFVLPFEGQPEPFYLITRGKMVGVLSNWEQVSPLVHGVSRATFRRLRAGITIAEAQQMVEKAIDNRVVDLV